MADAGRGPFTPRQFAFLTAADLGGDANYRAACVAANLAPTVGGYGILMAVDEAGARFTLVTDDVDYVRLVAAASSTVEVLGALEMPPGKFMAREGWPDDWVSDSHCCRCRRPSPPQDSSEFGDWEAYGDGTEVICPGCITGAEQQQMDEDMFDVEDEVRRIYGPDAE
jgi:hypothetical protein